MVRTFNFRMRSDDEVARYKFNFCKDCPFYECELVEEYVQFRESHAQVNNSQNSMHVECVASDSFDYTKHGGIVTPAKAVSVNEKDGETYLTDFYSADVDSSDVDILSYDQSNLEDGCIMSSRHVYQVECGRKTVTEGIGDHYKIEITEKLKEDCLNWEKMIKEDTEDRWEPSQPVFISAQTGKGKNYFIENTLIPYVRELNYREKTSYKILILSNRLALKQQIKNRIDGNDNLEDEENSEEGRIYSYGEVADVMTYQSLLRREKYLRKMHSRYIYVICDEAHFFTSDAMFNPHTQKILGKIVDIFKNVIRVYMSATPYECLKYINKYDSRILFYHFKRDYSYLDIKTYSKMNELYEIIAESIRHREKWLIFIDDKNKCQTVKKQLEELIKDKESKNVKSKDENTLEQENDKSKEKIERVYVINADSKNDSVFQEIVKNERLNKDTYVLISTSVFDNGINLTGIKNIVVSDMEKAKCMQMVGRARVEDNEHKTLYMKRFNDSEVDKRINNLEKRKEGYYKYELAYDENGKISNDFEELKFFLKYYNGKQTDWESAKHWFARCNKGMLYYNEIAKSMLEELIPQYQYILDEMSDEGSKDGNVQDSKCLSHMGQKYLEYQLSWFGKKYCVDDDITVGGINKSKEEFLAFLESYAESGEQIVNTGKESPFREEFTRLYDTAFGRRDRNKGRKYSITAMNACLEEESINYKIVSHSSYWVIEKCD